MAPPVIPTHRVQDQETGTCPGFLDYQPVQASGGKHAEDRDRQAINVNEPPQWLL